MCGQWFRGYRACRSWELGFGVRIVQGLGFLFRHAHMDCSNFQTANLQNGQSVKTLVLECPQTTKYFKSPNFLQASISRPLNFSNFETLHLSISRSSRTPNSTPLTLSNSKANPAVFAFMRVWLS